MIPLIDLHTKFDSNRSSSSEITCLIKMETDTRQTDRHTDGNGRLLFSYSRGYETSRKYKNVNSSNGLDYYTSLAYAREVKEITFVLGFSRFNPFEVSVSYCIQYILDPCW